MPTHPWHIMGQAFGPTARSPCRGKAKPWAEFVHSTRPLGPSAATCAMTTTALGPDGGGADRGGPRRTRKGFSSAEKAQSGVVRKDCLDPFVGN